MRASWRNLCLSLSILALLVAGGLWLFHHTARERLETERSGAVAGAPAAADPSQDGAGAGPADAEKEPSGEPGVADVDPTADGSAAVSIEGKVTDESGNGVAGARVAAVERRAVTEAIAKDEKLLEHAPLEALRAFQRSLADVVKRLPSSLTDAAGGYALRGLPAGDHGIVVTHPDFLPHWDEDWLLVETGTKSDTTSSSARRRDLGLRPGRNRRSGPWRASGNPHGDGATEGSRARQIFISKQGAVFAVEPRDDGCLGSFRVTSHRAGAYDLRVSGTDSHGARRDVASGPGTFLVGSRPRSDLGPCPLSRRARRRRGDPSASERSREPVRTLSWLRRCRPLRRRGRGAVTDDRDDSRSKPPGP